MRALEKCLMVKNVRIHSWPIQEKKFRNDVSCTSVLSMYWSPSHSFSQFHSSCMPTVTDMYRLWKFSQ